MSRALCPGCSVVNVPAGNVCWDCCYKTPQERQDESERLRDRLELAGIYQRDRFALAALTGCLATSPSAESAAQLSYVTADAMIEARKVGTP